MNKIIAILTLGLQIALTFIATICIYMVFALLDNDFGFDGLFGLFIIQPIIAVILSVLTIIACLTVGLPIRLNNKLNHWWTTNFYVPIIGAICGLAMLSLALLPYFRETVTTTIGGQETFKQIPNSTLSYIGWLITAFSLLHIYPPRQLTEKAKAIFQRTFKTLLTIFTALLLTNCNSSTNRTEKTPILKADKKCELNLSYSKLSGVNRGEGDGILTFVLTDTTISIIL